VNRRCGALALAIGLAGLGCASYRPASLPQRGDLARGAALDLPRLTVAASELHHPLLPPRALDLSHGLTPDDAALLALLLNPELRAARDAHGEAEAQLLVAGLLPNPELNGEATHPSDGGGEALSNTLAASLAVDLRAVGTRSAREAGARAELAQVDLGIAWQEWQVAQQARLLTVRLAGLRRRRAVARDEAAFAGETGRLLAAAVEAGDATLAQLGVQQAALEGVNRLSRELEQSEAESARALLDLLGRPPGLAVEVAPAPTDPPPAVATPAVPECLERRLDLDALRRGYEAEEAQLRLAVLEQFPALTIGLTAQRDETRLKLLGGFVTLGLPLFDRGRAAVALADATRTRLGHEYEARVTAARAEVAGNLELLELLTRQLAAARAALPPLAALEERERAAAARGDLDRLSYQEVRSSLFEQRLEEAALAQALAEARVALDTACPGAEAAGGGEGGAAR
jgi:outer membrane protein TolC